MASTGVQSSDMLEMDQMAESELDRLQKQVIRFYVNQQILSEHSLNKQIKNSISWWNTHS